MKGRSSGRVEELQPVDGTGAVEARRIVDVGRDRRQPGEKDHRAERDGHQDRDQYLEAEAERHGAEPWDRPVEQAGRHGQPVQQPALVGERVPPDHRHRGDGDRPGSQHQELREPPAEEALIEDQRRRQGDEHGAGHDRARPDAGPQQDRRQQRVLGEEGEVLPSDIGADPPEAGHLGQRHPDEEQHRHQGDERRRHGTRCEEHEQQASVLQRPGFARAGFARALRQRRARTSSICRAASVIASVGVFWPRYMVCRARTVMSEISGQPLMVGKKRA